MKASEFENIVDQKQTRDVQGMGGKIDVKHGPWSGQTLKSKYCHVYVPHDVCPSCTVRKLSYFRMVKARTLRSDSVLRVARCIACGHIETVDGDPQKTNDSSHRKG